MTKRGTGPVDDLAWDIAESAENAIAVCEYLRSEPADYSVASLTAVDNVLAKASGWDDEFSPEQLRNFAQSFGCYVFEVARRTFGGRYFWHEERGAPVLVVGEPAFRVALLTWDLVRGRLAGDMGCSVRFLYDGFADRVRHAESGTDALYV